MKAVCWMGKNDIRVEDVEDPRIVNPRDAILKITATAICGSDLHLVNGYMPSMQKGDIMGHEFMGEVVEVGSGVQKVKVGQRVVVPFTIACGKCEACARGQTSVCANTNPNAWMAEKMFGHTTSGLFGYTHMCGGYAGGQAEYVRVPHADVGCFNVPDHLTDEQVLFLSDVFPTGYMAAENCNIQPGDVVAVWGCGPVGQFAMRSAYMLGAERVIAIDRIPKRLELARNQSRAETINYEESDVIETLNSMTGGRGPDACIDAVGLEAHGTGAVFAYDKVKQSMRMSFDRPYALRQALIACRAGGTVSVPGVYGGFLDKIPFGAFVNKGLTLRTGQTHVHRYLEPLLSRIEGGDIDPSYIITHRGSLDDAPEFYKTFMHKEDDCVKCVMKPGAKHTHSHVH